MIAQMPAPHSEATLVMRVPAVRETPAALTPPVQNAHLRTNRSWSCTRRADAGAERARQELLRAAHGSLGLGISCAA